MIRGSKNMDDLQMLYVDGFLVDNRHEEEEEEEEEGQLLPSCSLPCICWSHLDGLNSLGISLSLFALPTLFFLLGKLTIGLLQSCCKSSMI